MEWSDWATNLVSDPASQSAKEVGRLRYRRCIAMACLLLVASCTSSNPSEPEGLAGPVIDTVSTTGVTTTSVDTVTSSSAPSDEPPVEDEPPVKSVPQRYCGSRVGLGLSENPEVPILDVGPISLADVDFAWLSENSYYVEPWDGDRYEGVKFVLVVNETAMGRVAVSIDEKDEDVARLVYDVDVPGPYRLTDGDVLTYFHPCRNGYSPQYNGGFIITAPRCVTINVVDEGDPDMREWSASIPFGVPESDCPGTDESAGEPGA